MREAILKRISKRTFTGEPVSGELAQQIEQFVEAINKESGLNAALIADGSAAFKSIKTSYGLFKNVRSMVVLKGDPELAHFREKVGYFGEALMLDLVDKGLGTCWVGGTFDREALSVDKGEEICALIVFGEVAPPTLIDRYMQSSHHSSRKPLKDRITAQGDVPDWVARGMEAVIPAPSAVNKQKPHFTYKEGLLTASVEVSYRMDLVDLGIAKYHFELGADNGGHFEWGNGAPYLMEEDSDD